MSKKVSILDKRKFAFRGINLHIQALSGVKNTQFDCPRVLAGFVRT